MQVIVRLGVKRTVVSRRRTKRIALNPLFNLFTAATTGYTIIGLFSNTFKIRGERIKYLSLEELIFEGFKSLKNPWLRNFKNE
ncbi:MAG: hypothetical protein HPY66_2011 [Firmicutes bacterium]|nr:hypothetical protein [Bacillota bacterium]